eukprot:g1729.t2
MPSLQDEVSVVGYPTGGDGVSVTEGVVSRIEIQTYEHSGARCLRFLSLVDLLAVQIDAAVNPGNSGGPVLNEDSLLIGVAFQNQQNSQNIGYVIPVPVIEHFLKDTDPQERRARIPSADPSRSQGFCSLGIFYQGLENDQLRESLALEHRTGVYVRGLLPLSPAQGLVFPGDVLLELENRSISNDGTFYVGFQERLSFVYLIQLKFPGQKVSVKLWRPGTGELSLQVPVFPLQPLVPITVQDSLQPWFLYGGMLFVVLTVSYLQEWGSKWLHDAPVDLEQIVILSKCYPSRRTAGYSLLNERYGWIQQLHSTEEFIHFNLSCVGSDMRAAVATETAEEVPTDASHRIRARRRYSARPRRDAERAEDVMRVYRIPADASLDLREGST